MATLVLQTAGAALGSALGGPTGATIGRALGGVAGAAIDRSLLAGPSKGKATEGPRIDEIGGLGSSEGSPIPRVYGRARVGGQVIWASPLREIATTAVERSGQQGGKSLGGGGGRTARTAYTYEASLAVALCEGPIAGVRRVWADGRELDLTTVTIRVHTGSEAQAPDPLIVAHEGADAAPAYRGTAYVVFEGLSLAPFGNRVPQLSFEVLRPVGGLHEAIRAACLIPGATEFGYEPAPVARILGLGATRPENRHQFQASSDVVASLDALQALCPNLRRVALVVSWFGDDLRAGSCTVAPRVDNAIKEIDGEPWRVAGLTRAEARLVSLSGGGPAYGGTPSDGSVVRLVRLLKARGLEVVLYPFVMMDVPAGNALPDPRTGAPGQPPYPWRGRITCDPAPGRPGSPDGTPAAAGQVSRLFGEAAPGDFALQGEAVAYSGPEEWSLRRLVLHYATLAAAAGGVDGIVIGSELVSLTRMRSAPGVYPAVGELVSLAADVRAVVGPATKVVYAADWTEYGSHVLDAGAELRFPLDPLHAHPAVDAVGIDFYPPLADRRDGAETPEEGPYDAAALRAGLASGEGFDWFYASPADRAAQVRTPITDGAYGKPWVYRVKDLVSWWSNPHVERMGGVEIGPTAWVPRSKPIWLTEIGIPAVDKGANGPNVFPDPKSSESSLPPFSRGGRDDLAQAAALQAVLSRFDPALPGHEAAMNPVSALYGGRMVDERNAFAWAWDARPFPAFPDFRTVWSDGANFETGHWLNGRIEGVELKNLLAAILADWGLPPAPEIAADGFLDGYVVDRPLSARAALDPLCRLFGVDATASPEGLRFRGRGRRAALTLRASDLVQEEREPALSLVRAEESELPQSVEVGFVDSGTEYRRGVAASRRLSGSSRREARADAAVVTRRPEAERLAEAWLDDLWTGRETARFALSPARVEVEPGDLLWLPAPDGPRLHQVSRIEDGPTRRVETRAAEPALAAGSGPVPPPPPRRPPPVPGRPHAVVLDLPAAGEPAALQRLAVAADPWPGAMAVWRSADGSSFALHRVLDLPAVVGRTLTPLPPGPVWRWDRRGSVEVELSSGSIPSIPDGAALAGGNLLAVQGPDGVWEILCAAASEMTAERRFRLSRLLRGLGGSEAAAARAVPAGAPVVRLDEAVIGLDAGLPDLGRPYTYRIGPASMDHAGPAVVELVAAAGPRALEPLSPVHPRARRTQAGVALAWTRRTRLAGDAWEPAEVPLGEAREAYRVEILSGGSVVRAFDCATPALLYAAADEIADFGAAQAWLAVRIAQLSDAVGEGTGLQASVRVG